MQKADYAVEEVRFMQSDNSGSLGRYGRIVTFLLSCVVVFTLHCRFEISGGGISDSVLVNSLNKLYNSFTQADFADLVVLFAVWRLSEHVFSREKWIDQGTGVLALLLSVLMVTCISFKKFNSPVFILGSGFQWALSIFCICGFWMLIYLTIRSVYFLLEREEAVRDCGAAAAEKSSSGTGKTAAGTETGGAGKTGVKSGTGRFFCRKHFLMLGFLVILLGWLPWILMNYPGTSCPDGNLQLKQFLGDADWAGGHPPLSTVIMGTLFSVGRFLADANFGFFLYCFFQTCVGAWIFAYSMKKLLDLGVPAGWCSVGILFFAFSPFWGTYAQWFEKDLLYAEAATLQAVFLLEVIRKKSCSIRDGILLAVFSILASLLRNNGIYAIVPTLVLLAVWFRKQDRKRVLLALLATVLVYEGMTEGLYYSVLNMAKPSPADALSIPFQQTARYVVYYGDELTEYEREVIDHVLSVEGMAGYDPVISDPVKYYYRGAELGEYFKVWFRMFWKHPGCYVSAFINKGYGYLAPVSQNIEAWIGLEGDYYAYDQELGIHHVFDPELSNILVQIWHLSMTLPLFKYLCTPGMYTWILLVLALLLWKRRKFGALILFIPSVMNVLVCLASPLASAIRYELPTVAAIPLLIGWTYYSLHEKES